MSDDLTTRSQLPYPGSTRFYPTIGLMAGSAVAVSAAVIIFFNDLFDAELLGRMGDSFQIAVLTMVPYMISAAVAAITAIGIVNIIPMTRVSESLDGLQERVRQMALGDMASRVGVEGKHQQVRRLARELNYTANDLGRRIAEWKMINRQQWDLLQSVRSTCQGQKDEAVILLVAQMEKNWQKIAAIEEQFTT